MAFILLDEIRGDFGVLCIERGCGREEVEDCGDDGERGCIYSKLNPRERWVVEEERDADVANMAVFECAVFRGIFFESHSAT